MIRRRLHRRFLRARGSDAAALLASFWGLDHWRWIDRFCRWHVARYGDQPGVEPWPLRPVSRFVCWCDDWRTTLSIHYGRPRPRSPSTLG